MGTGIRMPARDFDTTYAVASGAALATAGAGAATGTDAALTRSSTVFRHEPGSGEAGRCRDRNRVGRKSHIHRVADRGADGIAASGGGVGEGRR